MLVVEVLESLPGRPISGERLVRPDGKISLGFYGEVYVAGLTPTEAKEKIIQHLRKYIADEILGLVAIDDDAENEEGPEDQAAHHSDPKDTDRVFVDVTATTARITTSRGRSRYRADRPSPGTRRSSMPSNSPAA